MKKTEEIKRLLDALETSNKLAAEQIERNRHSIELLWQMLKEVEQGAPFDEPLPTIEIRPDAMYKDTHLLGGVPKDDKAPACLDGKGDTYIQPEEMKAGEWYFVETSRNRYLIKFNWIHNGQIIYLKGYSFTRNERISGLPLCDIYQVEYIRPATQAEILRYFPDEIECPTHGGNDAAYIKEFTDPQL